MCANKCDRRRKTKNTQFLSSRLEMLGEGTLGSLSFASWTCCVVTTPMFWVVETTLHDLVLGPIAAG